MYNLHVSDVEIKNDSIVVVYSGISKSFTR